MTKNVRNPESFSGERMRLACRRWRLANDFFLLLEEDFGEAPKSAREGARALPRRSTRSESAFHLNRFESELQIVD